MSVAINLIAAALIYPLCRVVFPRLFQWVGRPRPPRPARLALALCCCALGALWVLNDLHRIPDWLSTIASGVLSFAIVFSTDDDDDHRGPRRRAASALKRAKAWLAHGFPAPEPAGAR